MTVQLLFFDVFFEKNPHLNAAENILSLYNLKLPGKYSSS